VIPEEHVVAQVAEANPIPDPASPTPQERAEAERILRRLLDDADSTPPRRPVPRLGFLASVASVLVVVIVAAVVLRTGGSSTTGSTPHGGLQINLTAEPTPLTPRITASAMSREIALMRRRLASLGRGYTVRGSGPTGIVVTAPTSRHTERERIVRLVTQPAHLRFYDWEANVLTLNGKTVASQLLTQNRTALSVSQGGAGGAGAPGGGGVSLYDAVKLAARQPVRRGSSLFRFGPEYYVFGTTHAACAVVARALGTNRLPSAPCLLAGPVDLGSTAGLHQAVAEAAARFPSGRIPGRGEVVVVPQGTVVLQATQSDAAAPVPSASPAARFFVLRDNAALAGNDITHPRAGTDQAGQPDVTFGFTAKGQSAFQIVTGQITHRGANVSIGGISLNQHFAVALDHQIVTVPQIDFHQYPDGIVGGGGADVTGGLTRQSAKDLATELRSGPLPLNVRVVP
jgi:hypothetical protein